MTTGRVTTEGDDIYYEVRGQGQPLLTITGGLGDGGVYTFVADMLADEYKVVTYDRRGQSRSTRRDPQNFEISQQARDAIRVLQAAGEERAIVFGSSSGAAIGFEMAKVHPHAVKALIAHEPPSLRVLPDADRWLAIMAQIYATALTDSHTRAMADFMALMTIPPTIPDRELFGSSVADEIKARQKASASSEFGLRHELIPSAHYLPDVAAIRRNGTKAVLAVGKMSLDAGAFYGRTAPILAGQLGCEMVTFPGHHGSYMVNPREWTAALRAVLHRV